MQFWGSGAWVTSSAGPGGNGAPALKLTSELSGWSPGQWMPCRILNGWGRRGSVSKAGFQGQGRPCSVPRSFPLPVFPWSVGQGVT